MFTRRLLIIRTSQQVRYFSAPQKQAGKPKDQENSGKYNFREDPRLRNILKQTIILLMIVYGSGKLTKHLLTQFVWGGQEGFQDTKSQVVETKPKEDVVLIEERNIPRLTAKDLESKAFFGRNRNYFIQVSEEPLSEHYYQLKRLARKKSQPLFPYRLQWRDISPEILGKAFNVDDWDQVSHIVVNEDGLKIPVMKGDESGAIAFKFMMNPAKINDLDELYDAFDANKGSNVKYVVICNPGNHSSPADMTL
jgi:hypothetical protein